MFLLRHGQSHFNLRFNETGEDPGIEDPELTPFGAEQAARAAARLANTGLTRVVVSPFTRALQTAAPFLASRAVRVEIMNEVRERGAYTCDVGSPPHVLAARFPQHEFNHLSATWWHPPRETARAVQARADAFRTLMAERTDSTTTLLVSHWAFLLSLCGASLENAELREYDPCTGRLATV